LWGQIGVNLTSVREAFAIAGEFLQFLTHLGKQLGGLIGQRGIPGSSCHAIAVELNPPGQSADKPI
jgi:hypothetical protein